MKAHNISGVERSVDHELTAYVISQFPRLLTHLDRDLDSPSYGCFDRNYWHYKIQDFSSAILQQSVLALDCFANGCASLEKEQQQPLRGWAQASIEFWAKLPTSHGGFNEYYPHESGYPPTAFSLHAVSAVISKYRLSSDIRSQIQRAVNYLSRHVEDEALNQQAAGMAALALCKKLPGVSVSDDSFKPIVEKFFAAQHDEGWFPEYGGPDLGYLSVTIDMLWDYYDATSDQRALQAIAQAINYLSYYVAPDRTIVGICNSRNTDYIVPYGLARSGMENAHAAEIIRRIFCTAGEPTHFLASIDDRYHLHYVYNSCVRSLPYLKRLTNVRCSLPCDARERKYFSGCGNVVEHRAGNLSLFCASKKGAVLKVVSRQGTIAVDYGWRCEDRRRLCVTNFWNEKFHCLVNDLNGPNGGFEIHVEGSMVPITWFRPSPLKHMILRLTSFFLGTHLMPWLKKLLIFRTAGGALLFKRTIVIRDEAVLRDLITGRETTTKSWRAARPSARHVSSAGSFAWEELTNPVSDCSMHPVGSEYSITYKLMG